MPYRCVVYGCSNTCQDGVSLHDFPTSGHLRDSWKRFVCRTRSKWAGPTNCSRICSAHFKEDNFDNYLQHQSGLSKWLILNKTAIPSVHPVRPSTSSSACTSDNALSKQRQSRAFSKREALRIIQDAAENDVPEEPITPEESLNKKCLKKDAATQYDPPVLQTRSVRVAVNMKPKKKHTKSIGIQVKPLTQEKLVMCQRRQKVVTSTPIKNNDDKESAEESLQEKSVSMYDPSIDPDISTEDITSKILSAPPHEEEKFIVSKSCLWSLLNECPICTRPCTVDVVNRMGTMITLCQKCCLCEHKHVWSSQTLCGSIPAGNITLSAAIMFSGLSSSKVLRLFTFMNIPTISYASFSKHLQMYIHPTIWHMWKTHQEDLFAKLGRMEGGLTLAADGRSDSPGHSAKYGSYTCLETRIDKVINIELIQSNEVGSSVNAEKEGLIRSIKCFEDNSLEVSKIVTDRHPQIQKWLRENHPNIVHNYDVWHVAKGFLRKVEALSKQKGCEEVKPWIHSITNHMYWSATSCSDEEGDLILAKWLSLGNHIMNKHDGHGTLFPKCEHGNLQDDERDKKWLKPSTKAGEKLVDLITNTRLATGVKKLSTGQQTSNVEAFHSLILHFCPKMMSYSFRGMLCRLHLAALHYNENSGRAQATDKDGKPVFVIKFPKYKKGGYSLQRKKEPATYGYVKNLMECLCSEVLLEREKYNSSWLSLEEPPSLASQFVHPDRSQALAQFAPRFTQNSA